MKKLTAGIFTVLMGLVSVNAADAAVASRGYVDQQVGNLNTTVGNTYQTKVDAATMQTAIDGKVAKSDYDAKVQELTNVDSGLNTRLQAVEALNGSGEGSVSAQISALETSLKGYADAAETDAVAAAKSYADTELAKKEDRSNKLNSLNDVSEADASVKYPTAGAVLSYVNATNQDTSLALGEINEKIGDVADGKTVVGMIGDAQAAAEGKVTALANGAVKANTEAIAALDTTYVSEDEMDAFEAANTTAIATAKSQAIDAAGIAADGKITAAVGALDVAEVTAADGNYFNAYAETDGKISMEQKTFETTLADGVKNAPQTGAVKSYVDTAISNLNLNDLSRVPAECGATGKYCVLTSNGTNYLWEVIERATGEEQPAGTAIPGVE